MHKKIQTIILTSFLSLAMLVPSNITPVAAATKAKTGTTYTLKIKNKKQKKKSIGASFNGNSITTYAPGYSYSGTSMYSAYYVFGKPSSMGTSYKYNSKTWKITLKRGSTTITMKRGDNYAYVNGKKTKMPTPARRVYSYKNKKNYLYVPGAFCAKHLGLTYSYKSSSRTGDFNVTTTSSSSNNTTATTATTTSTSSSLSTVGTGAKTKLNASSSNYSIRLKKPSGLSNSKVSASDDYHNKRLRIVISGNYKSHFQKSSNRSTKGTFKSYSVSYSGGKTYVNLKTSKIKGYSVKQNGSYIYVRYATPRKMYSRVVVVDAGHGGSDSGAVGNGYAEKTMTLKIVKKMKSKFDGNSTYKVYYTRLSDWYPSLSYRYKLANEVNAQRFLSVHINSASASAKGTETLYKKHKTYAKTLQKHALSAMGRSSSGSYNRGLKYRSDLAVLNGPNMTTSLVEMGFISNKTEAKRIASRYTTIGNELYNAIRESF